MKKTDEKKPTYAALKQFAKALKRLKEQIDNMEPDDAAMISPSVLHEPEFVDRIIKAHKKKPN